MHPLSHAAGVPVPADAPFELTYLNARLPVAQEDELQQVGVGGWPAGAAGPGRVLPAVLDLGRARAGWPLPTVC